MGGSQRFGVARKTICQSADPGDKIVLSSRRHAKPKLRPGGQSGGLYMGGRLATVVVLAGSIGLAAVIWPAHRGAAESPFGDPNAEPAPFNPQMSALMSMLIQPRHAKLGLAGKAENWPLARYALRELRQGFLVVSHAVPRWKGLPVPDLVDAAMTNPITRLDFAIKLRAPKQFDEAYGELTAACNACHGTTDNAFIVIKEPDVSAFPNQEFQPK